MKVTTRGAGSVIAKALGEIDGVEIEAIGREDELPLDGTLYLFCQGLNVQERLFDHTASQLTETMMVNAFDVMGDVDWLLERNPRARIVVMGSDAGFKWSYNGAYAAAKAALHRYVETKRMRRPGQQLVCVAPSMIEGSGMIERRNVQGMVALDRRLSDHPKKRMVRPDEIAHLIHYLLGPYGDFVSGTVIRMNGGEHCNA
jgi:NAD(P)-dependent dehydrogenase (short-subunit alcohol dehydrogenase family)